jgi:hypothetical protein
MLSLADPPARDTIAAVNASITPIVSTLDQISTTGIFAGRLNNYFD